MTCPTPNNPLVWNCVSSDYLTGTVGIEAKCFTFADPADSGTPTNQVPNGGFVSTNDCSMGTSAVGSNCHNLPIQVEIDTFDALLSLFTELGDFSISLNASQTPC